MNCSAVTSALGVFTQPEAEVEAQLDQVGYITFFGGGGGGRCGHDGMDNTEGGSILSFDRKVLDAIGFKLTGEASVQSGLGLGVWKFSRVGEAIQDVGHRNIPPLMRDQIFPKLV